MVHAQFVWPCCVLLLELLVPHDLFLLVVTYALYLVPPLEGLGVSFFYLYRQLTYFHPWRYSRFSLLSTGTSLAATFFVLPEFRFFVFPPLELVPGVAVVFWGIHELFGSTPGMAPFPPYTVAHYICWLIFAPLL